MRVDLSSNEVLALHDFFSSRVGHEIYDRDLRHVYDKLRSRILASLVATDPEPEASSDFEAYAKHQEQKINELSGEVQDTVPLPESVVDVDKVFPDRKARVGFVPARKGISRNK